MANPTCYAKLSQDMVPARGRRNALSLSLADLLPHRWADAAVSSAEKIGVIVAKAGLFIALRTNG